jgi:uncharacterized protein YoxC
MEKKTQSELELELKSIILQRKSIEKDLETYKEEIKKLQNDVEVALDSLKALQIKENNLQDELYTIQKESIKTTTNINSGLKKIFNDSSPLFFSLKDKAIDTVQKFKYYVDGTYFDQKWLEEKYHEYKKYCIQKGEEIKSKEEFQKIALALKKIQTNENNDFNFFDIISKVSKEVGSASTSVKNVFQSLDFVEKITNSLSSSKKENIVENFITEKPVTNQSKDKKTILHEWIKTRNIKKSKTKEDLDSLYKDYKLFVEYIYPNNSDLIYSLKGGAFTAALNRTFEKLEQETVFQNGKNIKKIGLKMKK